MTEVTISRELAEFLYGSGTIDGYSFGETRPDRKGAFWWRDGLRAALDAPVQQQEPAGTPSSNWAAAGEPDPHGDRYNCERAALVMGNITDDELANGAFLNYDQPLNLAGILAGTHSAPIAWMTAVKDRIRWLSRKLEQVSTTHPAPADTRLVEALEDAVDYLNGNNLNSIQYGSRLYSQMCEALAAVKEMK